MEIKDIINKLESLFHLDVDAIHNYNRAIEAVNEETIRRDLSSFRDDHERHTRDLSAKIREIGGQTPEFSRDVKGLFLEGLTALQSLGGTEGALKAVRQGEKVTNSKYQDALQWDVGRDVKFIIERNYEDEKRHLVSVERMLAEKPWERTTTRV